jgi:hypothetical protein
MSLTCRDLTAHSLLVGSDKLIHPTRLRVIRRQMELRGHGSTSR